MKGGRSHGVREHSTRPDHTMKGHHMAASTVTQRFQQFHLRSAGLAEAVLWVIRQHPERDSDLGIEIIRELVSSYQVELENMVVSSPRRRG